MLAAATLPRWSLQPTCNLAVYSIYTKPVFPSSRPEPEAYSAHLAQLIKTGYFGSQPHCLNIMDFCSGTGCIALLLFALLQSSFRNLYVRGIDVSRRAVNLSRENLQHNISTGRMSAPAAPGQAVRFEQGDIFSPAWQEALCLAPSSSSTSAADDGVWNVMVSNPPYISARGFARDTARSVRNYEPKLAQVPQIPRAATDLHGRVRQEECAPEDVFYARLLEIAGSMRPKIILFEVGDEAQARRVVGMALQGRSRLNGYTIEIWRDWPDGVPEEDESTPMGVDAEVGSIYVKGTGHVRSVVLIRNK